ncbi:GtrA family protein [Qipengyuania vesicularis]|uniref:GtrA family protein n=1 Tax=Qipengyuania vesicularis TaxID=2867232 RepID=UPI001FFD2A96|nr:GtrA family protein [Qipengyuania vesicularis]
MARPAEPAMLRPAAILQRFDLVRLTRYGFASVAALAVDMGSFLLLLSLQVAAAPASAVGYSVGIVTHWLLSSRAVFTDTVAARGPQRTRQKALFVGSALVGLALTTLIVGAGDMAGLDPRIAKLAAIGVSFTATWLLRSKVVFRHID